MKWVEFLQIYYFVLKHRGGEYTRVRDALSRWALVVNELKVDVIGFELLRDVYVEDLYFQDIWETYLNPVEMDRNLWLEYMIQYGLLFEGKRLCIPQGSMRDNILKEKHNGGLACHFGLDNNLV